MDDKEIRLRVMEALCERATVQEINSPTTFLAKVEEISQYVINGKSGQPETRRRRGKAQDAP